MNEPRNEYQLVRAIQRAIAEHYPDAWLFKVVGNPAQDVGVPDLLACVAGITVGIEAKHRKPGESVEHAHGRVTAVQRRHLDRIVQSGGVACVALSVDDALRACRMAVLIGRPALELSS